MNRLARLNATDEMLAVATNSVGAARRIQLLWILPRRVDRAPLEEFWRRLDGGALSRRPSRPRVPGARRWWSAVPNAAEPVLDTEIAAGTRIQGWLDHQVAVPLDGGRLWSLSYRPTETGSIVALTVPHSSVDGVGLLRAIEATGNPGAAGLPTRPRPVDDVVDIAAQIATGVPDTVRWIGRLGRDAGLRTSLRTAIRSRNARPSSTETEAPQFFSTAFRAVPADAWQQAAERAGGTANSLFVTFAERLYRTAIDRSGSAPLDIGIPVSLRKGPGDLSANALVVVPLRIDTAGPTVRQVRELTKRRLGRVGPEDITLVPQAVWHHLPRGLAAALKTPGAQFTDAVVSNFGDAGEGVSCAVDGLPAAAVFVRTMSVPGVVPTRSRLRLSLCMIRLGDKFSMSITAIPCHFGGSAQLADSVDRVLSDLCLRAEKWTVA